MSRVQHQIPQWVEFQGHTVLQLSKNLERCSTDVFIYIFQSIKWMCLKSWVDKIFKHAWIQMGYTPFLFLQILPRTTIWEKKLILERRTKLDFLMDIYAEIVCKILRILKIREFWRGRIWPIRIRSDNYAFLMKWLQYDKYAPLGWTTR